MTTTTEHDAAAQYAYDVLAAVREDRTVAEAEAWARLHTTIGVNAACKHGYAARDEVETMLRAFRADPTTTLIGPYADTVRALAALPEVVPTSTHRDAVLRYLAGAFVGTEFSGRVSGRTLRVHWTGGPSKAVVDAALAGKGQEVAHRGRLVRSAVERIETTRGSSAPVTEEVAPF